MTTFTTPTVRCVIILTLFTLFLSGCALKRRLEVYGLEECKNRAYVQMGLDSYISRRYPTGAPVRMALVPFSVPANLASRGQEMPGVGNQLTWQIQQQLLSQGVAPIIEVFNRMDWPGKKEEFHAGNYTALQLARDAGYDLVFIGFLQPPRTSRELTAEAKIIEVETGITVWYGEATAMNTDPDFQRSGPAWWSTRTPALMEWNTLVDKLAYCMSIGVQGETPVP